LHRYPVHGFEASSIVQRRISKDISLARFFAPLASAVLLISGGFKFQEFLKAKFASRHSEMQNLNEWIKATGSSRKYPVSLEEKIAFRLEAMATLMERAQAANAIFLYRDEARKIVDRNYSPQTLEKTILQTAFLPTAQYAEALNQSFLDYWQLVVERVVILAEYVNTSPKTFREGLLKKK
jgi:hypothetical protein